MRTRLSFPVISATESYEDWFYDFVAAWRRWVWAWFQIVQQFGVRIPHQFDIPIHPTLSASGDDGMPEVARDPQGVRWQRHFRILEFVLYNNVPKYASKDEWIGQQKIQYGDVPEDIEPEEIQPMGNYAVSITWPDGFSQARFLDSSDLRRNRRDSLTSFSLFSFKPPPPMPRFTIVSVACMPEELRKGSFTTNFVNLFNFP